MIHVEATKFVSAEPGILPTVDNARVVVLSFGGVEGPIEDKAISTTDAMDLVKQVLDSLATLGNPLAQAIGEQFFLETPNEG